MVCGDFQFLKELVLIRFSPNAFYEITDGNIGVTFNSASRRSHVTLNGVTYDSLAARVVPFVSSHSISDFRDPHPMEFTKVIDGENCRLFCNAKKISDWEIKLYFYWMTFERETKRVCVRFFCRPEV